MRGTIIVLPNRKIPVYLNVTSVRQLVYDILHIEWRRFWYFEKNGITVIKGVNVKKINK